jgi:CHAT domain-containing protein
LHYVPFQALYDGESYVIERREVCYTPSAAVMGRVLSRPRRRLSRALLAGVTDEHASHVRDEIAALSRLFPQAVTLTGQLATLKAVREEAPGADLVHFACHGQFRADNPLFSSLRLADGWLTVRDCCRLNLNCEVVVLSACETGASHIAPGDEIIGLARGFFAAGAPSLLVSLWPVADEETCRLMVDFYSRLLSGEGPAAALRYAQRRMMERQPHPFFWSPFILLGRW